MIDQEDVTADSVEINHNLNSNTNLNTDSRHSLAVKGGFDGYASNTSSGSTLKNMQFYHQEPPSANVQEIQDNFALINSLSRLKDISSRRESLEVTSTHQPTTCS